MTQDEQNRLVRVIDVLHQPRADVGPIIEMLEELVDSEFKYTEPKSEWRCCYNCRNGDVVRLVKSCRDCAADPERPNWQAPPDGMVFR